jgi:hypothetical protein
MPKSSEIERPVRYELRVSNIAKVLEPFATPVTCCCRELRLALIAFFSEVGLRQLRDAM